MRHLHSHMQHAASLAAMAALVACTHTPAPPPDWPLAATTPSAAVAGDVALPQGEPLVWTALVRDARLAGLIALALAHNRDLQAARARLDQVRAQAQGAEAARLPPVTAGAGASLNHAQGATSRQVSVTLASTAWEIDLWGRVAALASASQSQVQASSAMLRGVQAAVVADTALAWYTHAADRARLELAEQTLASRSRSHTLTEQRHAAGVASQRELAPARAALEQARAEVAQAATLLAQSRHALALLCGVEPPESALPGAQDLAAAGTALLAVPANLPTTQLRQRPDVQAAEASLAAANAQVAAARAARWPTLSLTAVLGLAARTPGALADGGAGIWSLAPAVRLPLLDGGAGDAAVAAAQAGAAQQLAAYDQTVLTALREAADALSIREHLAERQAAQAALVQALATTLHVTQARQRVGLDSPLAVLEAQRTLLAAQQTAIALHLAEQASRLTLFKVLGGA